MCKFPPCSHQHLLVCFLDLCHSDWGDMGSQCGFNLYFSYSPECFICCIDDFQSHAIPIVNSCYYFLSPETQSFHIYSIPHYLVSLLRKTKNWASSWKVKQICILSMAAKINNLFKYYEHYGCSLLCYAPWGSNHKPMWLRWHYLGDLLLLK